MNEAIINTEAKMAEFLSQAIEAHSDAQRDDAPEGNQGAGAAEKVSSFREAGVLSGNEGLVVEMDDGSVYQVTIAKSK